LPPGHKIDEPKAPIDAITAAKEAGTKTSPNPDTVHLSARDAAGLADHPTGGPLFEPPPISVRPVKPHGSPHVGPKPEEPAGITPPPPGAAPEATPDAAPESPGETPTGSPVEPMALPAPDTQSSTPGPTPDGVSMHLRAYVMRQFASFAAADAARLFSLTARNNFLA
jgi:hypothetical protein